jgi:hypothetical protein
MLPRRGGMDAGLVQDLLGDAGHDGHLHCVGVGRHAGLERVQKRNVVFLNVTRHVSKLNPIGQLEFRRQRMIVGRKQHQRRDVGGEKMKDGVSNRISLDIHQKKSKKSKSKKSKSKKIIMENNNHHGEKK